MRIGPPPRSTSQDAHGHQRPDRVCFTDEETEAQKPNWDQEEEKDGAPDCGRPARGLSGGRLVAEPLSVVNWAWVTRRGPLREGSRRCTGWNFSPGPPTPSTQPSAPPAEASVTVEKPGPQWPAQVGPWTALNPEKTHQLTEPGVCQGDGQWLSFGGKEEVRPAVPSAPQGPVGRSRAVEPEGGGCASHALLVGTEVGATREPAASRQRAGDSPWGPGFCPEEAAEPVCSRRQREAEGGAGPPRGLAVSPVLLLGT